MNFIRLNCNCYIFDIQLRIEKAREKLRKVEHIVNGSDREARSRTRANARKENADTTTSSGKAIKSVSILCLLFSLNSLAKLFSFFNSILSTETDVQSLALRRSSLAAKRKPLQQNKSDPNISALHPTSEDPLSERKVTIRNLMYGLEESNCGLKLLFLTRKY